MLSFPKFSLLSSGGPPPQVNLPVFHDNEEMLLFAAWVHRMTVDSPAHRLAIFAFIQSHIANKAEENLQKVIAKKSSYWSNPHSGIYALNEHGYSKMTDLFGKNLGNNSLTNEYEFERQYKGHTFSVIVYPVGKIEGNVDGKIVSGASACRELEDNLGAYFKVKSNSYTSRLLNWIIQDNDYSWRILNYRTTSVEEITSHQESQDEGNEFASEDEEQVFPEGKEIYRLHRTRERSSNVIKLAKQTGFKSDPLLCCQVCGLSFSKTYGKLGEGFIEAHHTLPLSELSEETQTKVEDIALVCSNCHKMLHRRRPWLNLNDLKNLLYNRVVAQLVTP